MIRGYEKCLAAAGLAFVCACGGEAPEPPAVAFPEAPPEVRQAVREAALEVEEGEATFYADAFDRRPTASGEPLDQRAMVAAHRAFPFGTRVRVTHARTGAEVVVRVIDRGPFGAGRSAEPVIDLSKAAAAELGILDEGRALVQLEVLEWGRGAA